MGLTDALLTAQAAGFPGEQADFPLLSVLTLLPAVGAVVLALTVESDDDRRSRRVSLGIMALTALPALFVLMQVLANPVADATGAGVVSAENRRWFDATGLQPGLSEKRAWLGGLLGSSWHLGVDGTNLWMVMLAVLMGPVAVVASWRVEKCRDYHVMMLLLQTSMIGALLAQDLLLFYAFFEFTLVPGWLLIGRWGGAERRTAARRFFLYTITGSVLTLAGLLWLAHFHHRLTGRPPTFDMQELYVTLPLYLESAPVELREHWANAQVWLFLALFAAFAVKIPLFPLHGWLPVTYAEAPAAVTVVFAAVLGKLGAYGMLKVAVPLAPHGAAVMMPWVVGLACAGVVYGALAALGSRDIKRILAYSSLSHVSWLVVGIFAFNVEGMGGAVIQMVNHGIATGGLFLVAGFLYERWPVKESDAFGGLWGRMPAMAFFLVLFTLSSVGLPGLNGFVGEILILAGMYGTETIRDAAAPGGVIAVPGALFAVVTGTGVILGAWYMLSLVKRLLTGAEKLPLGRTADDFGTREYVALSPLAILVVVIGVAPRFFLRPVEVSVKGLVAVISDQKVRNLRPVVEPHKPGPSAVPPKPAVAAGR